MKKIITALIVVAAIAAITYLALKPQEKLAKEGVKYVKEAKSQVEDVRQTVDKVNKQTQKQQDLLKDLGN